MIWSVALQAGIGKVDSERKKNIIRLSWGKWGKIKCWIKQREGQHGLPIEHILTRKGLLKMVVEGRVPEKTCVGRPTLVVSRTTKRNADWRKFVNENLSYTCCKAEYRKTKKDKGLNTSEYLTPFSIILLIWIRPATIYNHITDCYVYGTTVYDVAINCPS